MEIVKNWLSFEKSTKLLSQKCTWGFHDFKVESTQTEVLDDRIIKASARLGNYHTVKKTTFYKCKNCGKEQIYTTKK